MRSLATEAPFFEIGAQIRLLDPEIHAAVERTIDGGYVVGGPLVEGFEAEFAEFIGAKQCIGVSNGLDAL